MKKLTATALLALGLLVPAHAASAAPRWVPPCNVRTATCRVCLTITDPSIQRQCFAHASRR